MLPSFLVISAIILALRPNPGLDSPPCPANSSQQEGFGCREGSHRRGEAGSGVYATKGDGHLEEVGFAGANAAPLQGHPWGQRGGAGPRLDQQPQQHPLEQCHLQGRHHRKRMYLFLGGGRWQAINQIEQPDQGPG